MPLGVYRELQLVKKFNFLACHGGFSCGPQREDKLQEVNQQVLNVGA